MTERRLDLTALDPDRRDGDLEYLIASINARAATELARRSVARGPFAVLAGWAMPTFAAAAALAAVSLVGALAAGAGEPARRLGAAEDVGLPAPVAEWVTEDRAPTADDLLLAMENGF